MSAQVNLGVEIHNARALLALARSKGFVGAGEVAVAEANEILARLLAIDAKHPMRFTVETSDIVDTEVGEVTGSQSRLVGDWWTDVPEVMPLSPGVVHQQGVGR